jgi:transcriptional regulator
VYVSAHFGEQDLEVMHALIRPCPLGVLVVAGAGGLEANHVPFLRRVSGQGETTLLGYVARANPVWRTTPASNAALVAFQAPVGYVSPNWCPSRREHGRVVPTWKPP